MMWRRQLNEVVSETVWHDLDSSSQNLTSTSDDGFRIGHRGDYCGQNCGGDPSYYHSLKKDH